MMRLTQEVCRIQRPYTLTDRKVGMFDPWYNGRSNFQQNLAARPKTYPFRQGYASNDRKSIKNSTYRRTQPDPAT